MAIRTISNAGGNWSSTSSWVGGVVPINGDDVRASSSSGNLTIDVNTANINSFDLTGYVNTISGTGSLRIFSTGTVTCLFAGTLAWTGNVGLYPLNGSTINLTLVSTIANPIDTVVVDGAGTVSQQNDFIAINFVQYEGTYYANNHNIRIISYEGVGGGDFQCSGGTFNAGSSTIALDSNFTGYPVSVYSNTSNFPSVYNLVIIAGSTVTFQNGLTYNINLLTATGTTLDPITINSDSPGNQFTLYQASGVNNVYYCSIQDSNAIGGAVWNASHNNGNVSISNNTGWNFAAIETYVGNLNCIISPQSQYNENFVHYYYTANLNINTILKSNINITYLYIGNIACQVQLMAYCHKLGVPFDYLGSIPIHVSPQAAYLQEYAYLYSGNIDIQFNLGSPTGIWGHFYNGNIGIQVIPTFNVFYNRRYLYVGLIYFNIYDTSIDRQLYQYPYPGLIDAQLVPQSKVQYVPRFDYEIGNLSFYTVWNSVIIITQAIPINDAEVDAGCPQCGTLLYNNPAVGTRG